MQKYKEPKTRRKRGGLQHIGIERRTLREEHWRGLSVPAKIFYLHLKGRYNGANNGEIELTCKDMEGVVGCATKASYTKAWKELETKGWIKRTKYGGLYRHKNKYKLTFKYDLYGAK